MNKRTFAIVSFGSLFLVLVGAIAANDEKEVAKHIKTLQTSKDKSARLSAVYDLALIASLNPAPVKPAIPSLIEAFKSDKDPKLRAAACYALWNSGADPKPVIDCYIAALNEEKDEPEVREAAAAQLFGYAYRKMIDAKQAKEARLALKKVQQEESKKDKAKQNDKLKEYILQALDYLPLD